MNLFRPMAIAAPALLLTLSAAVAQPPQQNSPKTGSSNGPATSSSPVATPGNSSGTSTVPEDADDTQTMTPEDARDDQTMTPEDGDDDQSMTPEDANDDANPSTDSTARSTSAARSNNVAVQNTGNEGCWARLYDAENFIGRNITLVGPAEMPDMAGTFRSIEVGPNAMLITFRDDHFADESARFGPSNRIANLREPGGSDEFESLRLTCAQTAAR